MNSIPPYVIGKSSPDRLWDWVIRTEPLTVGRIGGSGEEIEVTFSQSAAGVDPATLQRWAGEIMGEWNAVTDGIFPHASSSVARLAQEPFPSRFICHDRFDKFNALLTIDAAPFWILIMEDDKQGPVLPFPGMPSPSQEQIDTSWKWFRQVLISEFRLVPDWTEAKRGNQYTPNGDEIVWTTDGDAVRKGRFILDEVKLTSRSEQDPDWWKIPGEWQDESGAPITVTHWLWLDQWQESFPPPVPSMAA
jgi:hypothetical protein